MPLPVFWRENRDLFEFHDVSLSHISDVNLHALAVDEHREAFEPTPWRQQKFGNISTPTEQVWFAGAHADIGGGYVDEEKRKERPTPALDDITLDWMLKRVLHYYPDFPVKRGGKPAWPKISPEWAIAPQHEARTGFYRARPFALRSIGNWPVPIEKGTFKTNVCWDRHADPIGEMVHISVIERLGRQVQIGKSITTYSPNNLLATLASLKASPVKTVLNSPEVHVVDWSGKVLDPDQTAAVTSEAQGRLQQLSSSASFASGDFAVSSILPFFIALIVLLVLTVFLWLWWIGPREQVPPHLTEAELRRLEVQDRLRQTNYQILTAFGLGATFIATVFQLAMTSRQWNQDFELKTVQERLGQYANALKALSERGPAQISGINSLSNLALQDPDGYHSPVNDVLSALVRQKATATPMRASQECNEDSSAPYPRGEATPAIQYAMTALGNRKFASYRDKLVRGACESSSGKSTDLETVRLDHAFLDELDLSGRDLSCVGLSQAQIHVASLRSAILQGTDFRGARIADFENSKFLRSKY